MDRYARGAAPMAVLIAQGGSRGRAGSSWFLSLRLRLAINVFSCIFSNGVMRNAPVSHKLMCRWSYPFIYIPHRRSPPRYTYPHVPIQQGCRDILLSPDGADIEAVPPLPPEADEDGYRSCPLSTPWRRDEDGHSSCPLSTPRRRDEADSMQGGQACHCRVALMIKYFRTYVF